MSKPNILVLFCDQLRRDALGVYGDPNVSTPNLDRLAAQGVRFSNACSTYPICVPFRFSLITGEYAHTRFVPAIEWRMSPAENTIADEFNRAGYETIYCGKWHLYGGHGLLPNHTCRKANMTWVPPEFQGRFKKWLGFDLANNPFDTYYFEDADPTPKPLGKYQTDGLFDLCMNQLRSRKEGAAPFFCILSVEPPHFPLQAPKELEEKWKGRKVTLPPNFMYCDTAPSPMKKLKESDRQDAIEKRCLYYAMIENLDWNVGRMLAFLDETGLSRDTTVVFFSDHGQMDGSHSEIGIYKDHPYEESIGIPLIVREPGQAHRAGAVVKPPLGTEDLFPTLLGLAGLKPGIEKPGLDFSSAIRGTGSDIKREGILLEFVHDLRPGAPYFEKYWRGFRSKRNKYTVLGDAKGGGRPWQFYDLENDPYELINLIDVPQHQEEITRFHRLLREVLIRTRDHYVLSPAYGMDGLNLWA